MASKYTERTFTIFGPDGPHTKVVLSGRQRWMAETLLAAGASGVTPRDCPGVRLSNYVLDLRKAGIPVKTERERHGGAFAGSHGRYRLAAKVEAGATT